MCRFQGTLLNGILQVDVIKRDLVNKAVQLELFGILTFDLDQTAYRSLIVDVSCGADTHMDTLA